MDAVKQDAITYALPQFEVFRKEMGLGESQIGFFTRNVAEFLGTIPSEWKSWVTDDHSPYDWSVSITKSETTLRIVYEPQSKEPTLTAMKESSLKYLEFLLKKYPHLQRETIDKISKFISRDGRNQWFATDFSGKNHFKIYIFFETQDTYHQALQELGFKNQLENVLNNMKEYNFTFEGLSLDLDASRDNRVKFYLRFSGNIPNKDEFAENVNKCCAFKEESVATFLKEFKREALVDAIHTRYGNEQYFPENFLVAFVLSQQYINAAMTSKIHVPVRFYFSSDEAILAKVTQWLKINIGEKQALMYETLVKGICNHRDLQQRTGIQSLVAFSKLKDNEPEFTVYISPELYNRQF